MPYENKDRFTNSDFTAEQLGIQHQHDWTKSIDKMKFNQFVDDVVEKFEEAQAVNFADLFRSQNEPIYKHHSHNYAPNTINKLFINGNDFTLCRLDWRDLINGNCLKESLIGIFGYSWHVLKENAIIWFVLSFLQCNFGLFRRAFNAYNLKALLAPNITLAKIITSGLFGVFSQTIFHVLQSDFSQYKPLSTKKRTHSVYSNTTQSQIELNLLHKQFENFYRKFSSPVHNNSNKNKTSTLPTSFNECYDVPKTSHNKLDFHSLHLQTQTLTGHFTFKDSFDNDPDYQAIPKNSFLSYLVLVSNTFLF